MEQEKAAHIALFVTTGMGHWIPVIEFAKSLNQFDNHKFTFTLIAPTYGPLSRNQQLFLESLPNGIDFIALPPVNMDELLQGLDNVRGETRVVLNVRRSLSTFRDVVRDLKESKRLVALVVDLFGTDAFDVARELNISPYIFFPTNAMNLSLFLHMQELDKKVLGEYKDLTTPVEIPGCFRIDGKDLINPCQDRQNDSYKWLLHVASKYKLAEGIIVNSFQDLEPGPLKALQELGKPRIYAIGPLTQNGSNRTSTQECVKTVKTTISSFSPHEKCECVEWLSEQPHGSVLYVSFGSGGALTQDQMIELALGLESSNQRFLWVIKCPSNIPSGSYFGISNQDPKAYLPKGFMDRVMGRGLIVSNWAPQVPILNHGSVGGFMSHCGWNSILESMVNGIPLIVWPLYAEQRSNAVMLTRELKVALSVTESEDGLVKADEIAKTVRNLIEGKEGKEVRNTMRELKVRAENVLSDDGSSRKALANLVSLLSSKMSM